MNPITVTFSPFIYTDWGWKNLQNWIHAGFENYLNTPNQKTYRLLSRIALENTFNPWQGVITADDPRYAEYTQYFTNKVVDTSTKTFEKKAEVVKPTGNTATAASKAAAFGI